ncbi:MAG: hypothetical protein ACPGWR_11960 [Ardenticatenaceae bacterium]
MKIDLSKMQPTKGYLQGGLDALDPSWRAVPLDYKKKLSRRFWAINSEEITYRVTGDDFYVSKKIDGHLQLVVFNDEQIFMVGRGGVVRTGLPCLEEAKSILLEHGISSIVAAAELYQQKEGARSRVYDVIAALAHEELVDTLGLAFFDILEIDEKSLKTEAYATVFEKLTEIWPQTGAAHVVETERVRSKSDIRYLFGKWVEEEGGEGLVVRTEMPFMYKIKPKHTIDCVVVGYVEGINERKGKVKSLLFALMRQEGIYQIIGKVGSSLSEEQREEFLAILSQKHIDSTYIETDNQGIAFHMVQPEMVIEVGCNDIMTENTYGEPLTNNLIKFDGHRYSLYNTVAGAGLIYPVFERVREDKSNTIEDIRYSQLTDLVYLPQEALKPKTLPESTLLFREVYKKAQKNKIMVQKFVVWKSNKETVDPRYPGYVMHYTNFSSRRKEPLQTDIRISNSESQIMEIAQQFVKSKIKKGWEQVS